MNSRYVITKNKKMSRNELDDCDLWTEEGKANGHEIILTEVISDSEAYAERLRRKGYKFIMAQVIFDGYQDNKEFNDWEEAEEWAIKRAWEE